MKFETKVCYFLIKKNNYNNLLLPIIIVVYLQCGYFSQNEILFFFRDLDHNGNYKDNVSYHAAGLHSLLKYTVNSLRFKKNM